MADSQHKLPFEILQPVMTRIANRLATQYPGYERDEIFNILYFSGQVIAAINPKVLRCAARRAWIDFLRANNGRPESPKYTARHCEFTSDIDPIEDPVVSDTVEYIIRGLKEEDGLIVKMLAEGYRKNEIARRLNHSPAWVTYHCQRLRDNPRVRKILQAS